MDQTFKINTIVSEISLGTSDFMLNAITIKPDIILEQLETQMETHEHKPTQPKKK